MPEIESRPVVPQAMGGRTNRSAAPPGAQDYLRSIVANTPECIKVVAPDGQLLDMNRAGVCMVEADSSSQEVGKSVYDLIAPEHRQAFRAMNERVCGGSKETLEFEIVGIKGTRRRVQTTAVPIPNPNGDGNVQLAVARDITELRASEERLAAKLRTTKLLLEVGNECAHSGEDLERCLLRIVDAAVVASGADKGNLQLLNAASGNLVIAAQRGFEKPFLEFFSGVNAHCAAACAAAMQSGQRIVVEDVRQSVIFAGTPALEVMLAAGARAVQSTPLLSSNGKLLGMLSTHFGQPHRPGESELRMLDLLARQAADYLERKEGETALRESELRFRTMAEALPNLVWTDLPDGQCDWLSTQWGQYTGIPEKELLGLKWLERVIHPEDRQRTLECWQGACADRCPYDLEYRIRRHDGQYRWFKTRGVPARDEQGKIIYWFGTSTDIEDVKQAEMIRQRLAAIVESSDDAIISKDLNGIIASWNQGARRIFGYKAEEVIGKSVTILMPPDRVDEEPSILERIRRGERIDHYETVRCRKDGTLLNISLTVSPIKDANGKIIGASKIARDITERVRAKERLEQTVAERTATLREAIAQMEEFSYSVSHDLRAPLRAINGMAKAVLEDYRDKLDNEGKVLLERVVSNSARMEHLIHDVLTYSRTSRQEIQLRLVSLARLVPELLRQYPEFEPSKAEIRIEGSLPNVLAHEPSLSQAISNLIHNAVKFVAPGVRPSIKIRAQALQTHVRLWVEDNGIGIRPEHQHRLFGLFERIHPNGRYEGTGIGLAIVRKAVERMGGQVGVDSDGIQGSKFWIQLPSAQDLKRV